MVIANGINNGFLLFHNNSRSVVYVLQPFVDTTTMTIHHTKHHATYVNNINKALEDFPEFKGLGVEDLNAKVASVPDSIATAVRNNGGGHWNHSFFWKIMCNPSSTGGPSGALKEAIDRDFGSVEAMKEKFNAAAAARFGSGWAWLVLVKDAATGERRLSITSTPNQDNPLMSSIVDVEGTPILGLDVWEHAYYLKYQNRRPEYISAWWNVVNWEQAGENFNKA